MSDDAAIVLCTCSTLGICVDRMADPRVVRVDRAMAERAVALGKRVLVAACLASTIEPTVALLKQIDAGVEIETLLMEDLWPYFGMGEQESYRQGITARLRQRALASIDCIVLAQASMASAAECLQDLGIPVLASSRLGLVSALTLYYQTVRIRK